ncbi:hypothetical protein AXI76_gp099 [Pseudoalteromonas phage H101]|uniref:Uncharacterized protein n=1 Tax=Pseudoalteromonas phage H101 TaxID=1654919 RepID=A0A0H4J256_9CAUD|nr:hypothetical protein AXI76_gp099 [Pseudoalteromonas phage H101]AKO61000.1 hypothetical protein [Pseudoalteromonas phage H101]
MLSLLSDLLIVIFVMYEPLLITVGYIVNSLINLYFDMQ